MKYHHLILGKIGVLDNFSQFWLCQISQSHL
nr:MAG TPA: hypothetical protein [Bacteriophage sp.]